MITHRIEEITAQPRAFLADLFDVAVKAANPKAAIRRLLPPEPKGRTVVVGAGKAAARMAEILEDLWEGSLEGAVVTKYGEKHACNNIKVLFAAHPVPDRNGLIASRRLLDIVSNLKADDLVIALISGGGSALLPAPPNGMTLEDEIQLNKALLASGAPISVMNAIRKQFSQIKGGQLALAASPARIVTIVVSDVPGDILHQVASGPTIPDSSSPQDAHAFIEAYDIQLPQHIRSYFESIGAATPSPDYAAFKNQSAHLAASSALSLHAAAEHSAASGLEAHILSDCIEGEASEIAKMHGAIAKWVKNAGRPFGTPCVLLSGGETTVTIVDGKFGRGGRNTEFLLSLSRQLAGEENTFALCADTDGIDGSEENAGAFVDGKTWERLKLTGKDPNILLRNHDAWTAFDSIDDLFVTGPTGTNINDFRAILIL